MFLNRNSHLNESYGSRLPACGNWVSCTGKRQYKFRHPRVFRVWIQVEMYIQFWVRSRFKSAWYAHFLNLKGGLASWTWKAVWHLEGQISSTRCKNLNLSWYNFSLNCNNQKTSIRNSCSYPSSDWNTASSGQTQFHNYNGMLSLDVCSYSGIWVLAAGARKLQHAENLHCKHSEKLVSRIPVH